MRQQQSQQSAVTELLVSNLSVSEFQQLVTLAVQQQLEQAGLVPRRQQSLGSERDYVGESILSLPHTEHSCL